MAGAADAYDKLARENGVRARKGLGSLGAVFRLIEKSYEEPP